MAFTHSGQALDISRLHWPVTTLGYGQRAGIWFQGCSIRCPGCCSVDTWQAGGSEVFLEQVFDWIRQLPVDDIAGFTISGGEPFDQPEALFAIVDRLRNEFCAGDQRDILVYSGYSWITLCKRHDKILQKLDVVVSEPYLKNRPVAYLRGSDNQHFHCFTALAQIRYPHPDRQPQPALQFHLENQRLWLVGIPQPGSLDKMQQQLELAGIYVKDIAHMG